MRTRLAILGTGLLLMLVSAGSGAAHDAGPCTATDDPGHSEYAQHHIVFMAHEEPGAVAEHNPGKTHQGFSACNPSGR
jgi:hypothetical protein